MLIPRDSVGSQQLKADAVTSTKVRDFSLRAWDFKRHSLPQGEPGPQGPPGVVGDLILHENSIAVPGNSSGNAKFVTRTGQVMCPSGEKASTGGTRWPRDAKHEHMFTRPSPP